MSVKRRTTESYLEEAQSALVFLNDMTNADGPEIIVYKLANLRASLYNKGVDHVESKYGLVMRLMSAKRMTAEHFLKEPPPALVSIINNPNKKLQELAAQDLAILFAIAYNSGVCAAESKHDLVLLSSIEAALAVIVLAVGRYIGWDISIWNYTLGVALVGSVTIGLQRIVGG